MTGQEPEQEQERSLATTAIENGQSDLTRTQTQHSPSPSSQPTLLKNWNQQDQPPTPVSRWRLRLEAALWRVLMEVGMVLHRVAPPVPPYPTTRLRIPSTISSQKGHIGLYIYSPPTPPSDQRFPCIVNFHGGGFTIGKATDDARWAAAVVEQVPAIVVSVDYRLAPAHPFPTAVQDGVDALLYIHAHADELGIDVGRIALSGFSAGGNLVFTVPLLLNALQRAQAAADLGRAQTPASQNEGKTLQHRPVREDQAPIAVPDHLDPAHAAATLPPIPPTLRPHALIASYPSLDFSQPRAERRATNTRQDLEMPSFLHTLFDASYLFPLPLLDVFSPFLSPARASDEQLVQALPRDVAIYAAEWDGLSKEAMAFAGRLGGVGKRVQARVLEGTTHGWDRGVNPLRLHRLLEGGYRDGSAFLREVFRMGLPEHLRTMESREGEGEGAEAVSSRRTVEDVPVTDQESAGTTAERN
ncbi:unnamed protein product [Tilletia caries]|uniref:Alpha/beta hydrolase fold-3 domain-containing protein n=3 Tax=Tilletia TaxID=13289 RepID=A0A8X7MWL6_9BASI|nr:hypothetical protein CF336_g1438 [Tilletia laevis]KAE8252685.1 hypothetical protein A4X06_0g2001 [Tilletia controversa]KAE8263897.1 hypothetical protein A4X03_0g1347 [Tilletia caries]KAE8203110.1 hypothetical protein CF335_g3158 [Tilletia laevis]CAD6884727.1 unnamed protein product [Tilletia caries]